jgi:peptide/nickel transport system permease protein
MSAGPVEAPRAAPGGGGRAAATLLRFLSDPLAAVSLAVFLVFILSAMLAPWVAPHRPYDLSTLSIMDGRLPPGSAAPGGGRFLLGTDSLGRDIFSSIIYGTRTSILVALTACAIALAIGTVLGLLAGYYRGIADTIIMRAVDLKLGFPAILIALILLAVLGRGIDKVILALVVVQWAYFARIVRGVALVEAQKDYVEAARMLGAGPLRILLRHLLPNCLPPLIVLATAQIASAIALEATLSFLGIGLPVTAPSLGLLIANGFKYILSGAYWISFFPGLALFLLVLSVNFLGDRLGEVVNPHNAR